jgi:hypothetical protein
MIDKDTPANIENRDTDDSIQEELPNLRLTIELQKGGDLRVEGPIFDKILCYGLLETAKDIIRSYKPKIEVPKHSMLDWARKK